MEKVGPGKSPNRTKAIHRSLDKTLNATTLLSLATVSKDGVPHSNTAFFARDGHILYFLSDVRSTHGRNIRGNAEVAVTIFDSRQKWDADKCGVQLFGRAQVCGRKLEKVARSCYAKRFPAYAAYLKELTDAPDKNFKFFAIHIDRFVLLDEKNFGEEEYIHSTL